MKRLLKKIGSFENILALRGCQTVGYCEVLLNDKKVILGGSIANLSVGFDERFIRVSRTALVNKNHIVSFDSKSVSLSDGSKLLISRRRSKLVLDVLK